MVESSGEETQNLSAPLLCSACVLSASTLSLLSTSTLPAARLPTLPAVIARDGSCAHAVRRVLVLFLSLFTSFVYYYILLD